jgi:hypothetical protein
VLVAADLWVQELQQRQQLIQRLQAPRCWNEQEGLGVDPELRMPWLAATARSKWSLEDGLS